MLLCNRDKGSDRTEGHHCQSKRTDGEPHSCLSQAGSPICQVLFGSLHGSGTDMSPNTVSVAANGAFKCAMLPGICRFLDASRSTGVKVRTAFEVVPAYRNEKDRQCENEINMSSSWHTAWTRLL